MENQPLPPDERPPYFKTWKPLYILVLVIHAFILFLFWWFTHSYS